MTESTENLEVLVKQAKLIIPRLEKITPDSSWAHRASGCRGSLIRLLALQGEYDNSSTNSRYVPSSLNDDDLDNLRNALERSFGILEGAAAERLR
jgi:hypothetical protein